MKNALIAIFYFIFLVPAAQAQTSEEINCPVYRLEDDVTFDTSLQSLPDGDEDYAWLGIDTSKNSVIIGYYGWSYPDDHSEYTVVTEKSDDNITANIRSSNYNFIMVYNRKNRCISLRRAVVDAASDKLVSGELIAQGRCGVRTPRTMHVCGD